MRADWTFIAFASMSVMFGVQPGHAQCRQADAASSASPPAAPVRPVTHDYYGTKVMDPYRYMENLQDPEVQAWMKAQKLAIRPAGIPAAQTVARFSGTRPPGLVL